MRMINVTTTGRLVKPALFASALIARFRGQSLTVDSDVDSCVDDPRWTRVIFNG